MALFIGLMSGTSMDGIDTVLVDSNSNTLIHGLTCPYGKTVKRMLWELVSDGGVFTPGYYSQLNTLIGREFAMAVLKLLTISQISAKDIVAIGSHGQTICHDAAADIPYTVQVGCGHTIAEMTGIQVVADFRTRDLVLGGQGAPFAPVYHQALFKNQEYPLTIVNIGGIANLTCLPNETEVSGYDLGPGNCLMDAWIDHYQQKSYDKNGDWAASGQMIDALLNDLLEDPWFQRPCPKSIGKEYFTLAWLKKHLHAGYVASDVQATLLQLTAHSIAMAVKGLPFIAKYLLVCGGGVHNTALMNALSEQLPQTSVLSTQAYQIHPDFIEAMMFAWLAEQTLASSPLNLKPITGARHSAILGAIYPAGIDKGISHEV